MLRLKFENALVVILRPAALLSVWSSGLWCWRPSEEEGRGGEAWSVSLSCVSSWLTSESRRAFSAGASFADCPTHFVYPQRENARAVLKEPPELVGSANSRLGLQVLTERSS